MRKFIINCLVLLCVNLFNLSFGQELFTKDFDPSKSLDLPLGPGKQICFASVGRWEPDMKGAAGIDVSSFGGHGIDHLSLLRGEFDLAKNYPGKPFKSKTAKFFSIIWCINDSKEFKTVEQGQIGNTVMNRSDKTVMVHFMMNDEVGEYYNNSGWLRFIYFYKNISDNDYRWRVNAENFFKIDSYWKNLMQPSSIPGLKYEWVLNHYNSFSKKYDYTVFYHNTTAKEIKFKAKYTCNKGTVDSMSYQINAGEYIPFHGISRIGMSISITFKLLSPQTVIPAKAKFIQQYNKLAAEAASLSGTARLDKLYDLKNFTELNLPEKTKEVEDWIAATKEEIKDGPLVGFTMSKSDLENPVENCPPCPAGQKTHVKVMEEGGVIFGRECECIEDENVNKTKDIAVNHTPPLTEGEFNQLFNNFNSSIDRYCVVLHKMLQDMGSETAGAAHVEEFTSAMQNFQNSFFAFANKTMKKAQFEKLGGSTKKLEPCINECIQKINSLNIGGQTFSMPPIQLPDISTLGVTVD